MNDLISRKATLKHIEKIRHSAQMMDDMRRENIIMTGMDLLEEAVMNQPSIQSEVRPIDYQDFSIGHNLLYSCMHYKPLKTDKKEKKDE